jgi:hypothetical protein
MIQLYAWAAIRESFEMDSEETNLPIIEKIIREKIDTFNWTNGMVMLKFLNGNLVLSIAQNANRIRNETKNVFKLYAFIMQIAKGSYGLIYLHDDEDPEKANEFQVFVLARGKLEKRKDIFLSPLAPTIED